jgi:Ca-activated chloride channel family protein
VPIRTDREGFHRYRVSLEASPDGDPRNNLGRFFVRVRGKPRVLLAEGGAPDPTRALERALRANNLEVTRVSPATFPARAEDLQNYDAILLHDFPATALSPQMMLALQSAVRDTGIGFAMIGGENSFLPGGYYETPIAEMLPVDLDVRQRKVFPPATVVIIVDISGSMSVEEDGIPKIQLAARAAIETLKLLRPHDQFGVIVSGTGVDWLAPIQKAENRERGHRAGVADVRGGWGDLCAPVAAVRRECADADPDHHAPCHSACRRRRLRRAGGVFRNRAAHAHDGYHDVGCVAGAREGCRVPEAVGAGVGGNFYLTERARDLPRLFTADVSLMTRSAIEEGAFIPKVSAGDEILQGIDWSRTPPLLAYDLTSDRPLARTLMRTHKDDPLLAVWQYGLGQSLAFTSDAKPKWALRWVGWSEFAPLWTQLTRGILRKGGKQRYETTVRLEGGEAIVEMQAFTPQGEPINFLQPEVRVGLPTGEGLTIALAQEAPGRYVGRFPARGVGDYTLSVVEKDPDGTTRVSTTGFAIPYPSEYRFTRANLPLLTRLAELTGGKVNPTPAEAFRPVARQGQSVRDLWRSFLWLALALLLLDITVRRVVIPLAEWAALLRGAWERVVGRGRARRPAPQAQASARLLGVKARAATRRAEPDGATPVATPVAAAPPPPSDTATPTRTPQPTPTAVATTPADTTSRLLERKRQRRQ